jgi:hypothetical protein
MAKVQEQKVLVIHVKNKLRILCQLGYIYSQKFFRIIFLKLLLLLLFVKSLIKNLYSQNSPTKNQLEIFCLKIKELLLLSSLY